MALIEIEILSETLLATFLFIITTASIVLCAGNKKEAATPIPKAVSPSSEASRNVSVQKTTVSKTVAVPSKISSTKKELPVLPAKISKGDKKAPSVQKKIEAPKVKQKEKSKKEVKKITAKVEVEKTVDKDTVTKTTTEDTENVINIKLKDADDENPKTDLESHGDELEEKEKELRKQKKVKERSEMGSAEKAESSGYAY